MKKNRTGRVYLIRLDSPLGSSHYYCGWARSIDARLAHHRAGRGSRFLAEANRRGITYSIIGDWKGDKTLERAMKNTKNLRQFDPCIKGHKNPLKYPFRCNLPKNHPVMLILATGDIISPLPRYEYPKVYSTPHSQFKQQEYDYPF